MKNRIAKLFVLILVLFSLITGCDSSSSSDSKSPKESSVKITKIYWTLQNIGMTHWKEGYSDNSCFFVPKICFDSNKEFTADDVEIVKFELMLDDNTSTGSYWTFPLDKNPSLLDVKNKSIGGDFMFYTSAGSYEFPLGKFKFSIQLKNENPAEYLFELPSPGSTTASPYSFVYNEDFKGVVTSKYTNMIKRAIISEATFNSENQTLTVKFSTDDGRVYNGNLWFYDSEKNYLGDLQNVFRDCDNRLINSYVNSGVALYTDNKTNTLVISKSNLALEKGDINSIKFIEVILMDGYQYLDRETSTYDCYSVSGKTAVVLK